MRKFVAAFSMSVSSVGGAQTAPGNGSNASLGALLSVFFDVGNMQIDLREGSSRRALAERGGRRQITKFDTTVQLEDDRDAFVGRLTAIHDALAAFLGPRVVHISPISASCGQGHFKNTSLPGPMNCQACAITTYKEDLEDEGFNDTHGCMPCPSPHMLTPPAAVSAETCTCDAAGGYTQSTTSICARMVQFVSVEEAEAAAIAVTNVVLTVTAANVAVAVATSVGGAVSGVVGGGMVGAEAGVGAGGGAAQSSTIPGNT